jgi:hypothetical protein
MSSSGINQCQQSTKAKQILLVKGLKLAYSHRILFEAVNIHLIFLHSAELYINLV